MLLTLTVDAARESHPKKKDVNFLRGFSSFDWLLVMGFDWLFFGGGKEGFFFCVYGVDIQCVLAAGRASQQAASIAF